MLDPAAVKSTVFVATMFSSYVRTVGTPLAWRATAARSKKLERIVRRA
jgi:hypothetical protein